MGELQLTGVYQQHLRGAGPEWVNFTGQVEYFPDGSFQGEIIDRPDISLPSVSWHGEERVPVKGCVNQRTISFAKNYRSIHTGRFDYDVLYVGDNLGEYGKKMLPEDTIHFGGHWSFGLEYPFDQAGRDYFFRCISVRFDDWLSMIRRSERVDPLLSEVLTGRQTTEDGAIKPLYSVGKIPMPYTLALGGGFNIGLINTVREELPEPLPEITEKIAAIEASFSVR